MGKRAEVAQSVEQGTENPRVGGSIPPLGTSYSHPLQEIPRAVINQIPFWFFILPLSNMEGTGPGLEKHNEKKLKASGSVV